MALKVLLADDSSAIKKVVQLCLQDFAVELKSVGSGKDVLDVARSFSPEIAFVDVLLPHKTGYEIASEMKKDPQLKNVPIVMLWSSFMEIDEKKFKACGAEDKLEKPFDVAGLRSLVSKHVPRTLNNPLAKHLEFPTLNFIETTAEASSISHTQIDLATVGGATAPSETSEPWSMSSFEDISTFSTKLDTEAKPAPQEPEGQTGDAAAGWSGDSEWIRKDLGKFRVPVAEEEGFEAEPISSIQFANVPDEAVVAKPLPAAAAPAPAPSTAPAAATAPATPKAKPPVPESTPKAQPLTPFETAPIPSQLSEKMAEEIKALVEKQGREMIEKAVWKIVPEIAANLIREEIQRLIGEKQ